MAFGSACGYNELWQWLCNFTAELVYLVGNMAVDMRNYNLTFFFLIFLFFVVINYKNGYEPTQLTIPATI